MKWALCACLLTLGLGRVADARPAPQDTTLRSGTLAIPFALCGNLPFIPVRVNGSDTLSFLIDSGANACVIDLEHARSLNLKRLERVEGSGAGKGSVETWILDHNEITFSLPGLDLHAELVAALDLSRNLSVLGRRVDGILGYDLLDRFLVEMDYDAHIVFLSPRDSVLAPGSGIVLPLVFSNRLPHVEVMLTPAGHAPIAQTLLIDSGSNDAVDDSLLALSTSPLLETVSGVGQGQEFKSVMGRWASVELGSLRMSEVPGGAGGVAIIGGALLRHFAFAFDFGRRRLILTPNRHFHDAFFVDASGLDIRLVPESGAFRVHDVAPHSPAQEAGFLVGDLITFFDGTAARNLGIRQVESLLEQPGRTFRMTVHRQQQELKL